MLIDTTVPERLTQLENELRQLLSSIGQLLSELADCEADAGCRIPDAPVGELSQGIAGMLFRLRDGLVRDDLLGETERFGERAAGLAWKISRLREDRKALLRALDELLELAVSTSRVSSWSDIEVRFFNFALSLSEHLARQSETLRRRPRQLGAYADLAERPGR